MTSDYELSAVLSEFARTMVTDFPIQAILDRLVERIVDVLPICGAGVTLIAPGAEPHYIAASDDLALRFEKLQTELGEGPCVEAYRTGEAIVVPDLHGETRFANFARQALEQGLVAVFTFPLRHGDGRLGALDLYSTTSGELDAPSMDAAQTLADVAAAYLLNAQARADLLETAVRSRAHSMHDPLTGLPNRVLFLERLEHALLQVRRTEKMVAVLYADLDRFKAVNDTYGHMVGDQLLVAVAQRVAAIIRPGDTLARLSGDEFVLLCEDLNELTEANTIAVRIGTALSAPFFLSGIRVDLTASVGIAYASQGGQIPEEILHNADTAMYQAKRSGGGRHASADVPSQRRGDMRASMTHDLSGASVRGEFHLDYQPIVGLGGGELVGVEALLRWAHPHHGTLDPITFIGLAERAGLIDEIGRWVLNQACQDTSGWGDDRQAVPLTVALNVSAHQLMSRDFAATVGSILARTLTNPEKIVLEMTETAFIQDGKRALGVLTDLKELGVSLALDDFGTGYSSLSHLRRFPVNIVKIDKSFVADLTTDTASHAIVSSIIDLSHNLGISVIAEGVETAAQHDELVALGCDSFQGFHFARPMSALELHTLMQTAN